MHIEGINVRVAITLLLLLLTTLPAFTQERMASPVRIMFYNVENLFDTYDDPLTADDDFLPSGVMRWSYSRYRKKINSVYKTIIAAGEWDPPSIVAFCEIENKKVIEDLINMTSLSRYGYSIVHGESPDPRGIDVALIYRRSVVQMVEYKYLTPGGFEPGEFTSRNVLYAKMATGSDTLHIMVSHWPSRRGGVLAGERLRGAIADMIRLKADSLCHTGARNSKLIIAGDFNATPEDPIMKNLIGGHLREKPFLFNLSEPLYKQGKGTYRYMGVWEMIDQFIVSEGLLKGENGLVTGYDAFGIFSPEFLLRDDPRYPGKAPWPTYRGYIYQGGYSDHLPVILDLYHDSKGH